MVIYIKKLARKILNRITAGESGDVFRGMLVLLLGSGVARLIGIGVIPILTRIYTPEEYGVLAVYTSFVTILAPMLTLRYVQAIPLPKTELAAAHLVSIAFLLLVTLSIALLLVFALFKESLFAWFNMQALVPWWFLVVLGASGAAFYELLSLWATRRKQYKIISKTQFNQSLIGNTLKVVLGLLSFKSLGLIVGQLFSQSAGISTLIRPSLDSFKNLIPRINVKTAKLVARYYQDFVWFRLPSHLLMVLSLEAPVLLTSKLFEGGAVGQISLAMMALSLPVSLIGMSMSRAYYAEIASIGRNQPEKIRKITFDIQKKLFAVGLPVSLFIFFFAESVFALVFGEQWRQAGIFASYLSPYVLLRFTSSSLDQVLNVLGSQLMFLIINVLRVVGFIGIFYVSIFMTLSLDTFVYVLSAYLFIYYLGMTLFILYVVHRA